MSTSKTPLVAGFLLIGTCPGRGPMGHPSCQLNLLEVQSRIAITILKRTYATCVAWEQPETRQPLRNFPERNTDGEDMRRNVTPVIMLALNISQAARSLNLRSEHIRQALLEGKIIARQSGNRRLIAIGGEGGLQQWLESFPQAKPKTRKVSP